MRRQVTELMGLLFFGLLIVTLVRPSSVGPQAVADIGDAMTALVRTATAP